ncbi:hypothetical protein GIB67_031364 [Kingdonia uniflora]|uniref:Uncharacterized protein n=1 Tax=Kingdonia uniflora TaxID=39325 RepID=A0A7J7MB38_9MAGN|nr:hypothetical protein GIB67_031364 [Kingdonia uniflora]
MATSGFAYDDIMEIPACTVGTSISLVRRPRVKRTMPPSEQIAPVLTPQVGTEGVDADLSVAWKSAAEVLKVAAADHAEYEVEKASLAEQLKERTALCEQLQKEKVLQKEQFVKEKALQKDQFKKEATATKKEVEDKDVDLVHAGKYSEIIFPGDDASLLAEQGRAPPVADDTTKEEVVCLRRKVSEMEKALRRARDSINRTQQDKQFADESDKLEYQRSLLSLMLNFEAEVDNKWGLKESYLELLTKRGIVPDLARVKFLAQEARNHHSIEVQRCSAQAGISIIWGGVGLLPDELNFFKGKEQ